MKGLYLLLVLALLCPTAAFAEDGIYEEKIYVVQQQNRRPVDDLAIDCAWASQLAVIPIAGNKSDLYSVQSKKTTGLLLKDDIKKVGELLGCYDIGSPQLERGVIPTYDFGQVWLLKLDGNPYIVTGMSRLRTNPAVDDIMGVPGNFLGVGTGTIFTPSSILENPPVPVGSFAQNYISHISGLPQFRSEGILTIRLYSGTINGNGD